MNKNEVPQYVTGYAELLARRLSHVFNEFKLCFRVLSLNTAEVTVDKLLITAKVTPHRSISIDVASRHPLLTSLLPASLPHRYSVITSTVPRVKPNSILAWRSAGLR